MNQRSISERADYLSRRRARMLPFLAIIYFTQQASFLSALGDGTHRDVDHFKIGAWVVLSLVLLAALAAYFIAQFQPLTVGETAHLVLTFGLGAALIRFGLLERRAHQGG